VASTTTALKSIWSLASGTKWAIIICIGVAALIVVAALHPIPQPLEYHNFADKRALLGVPNAGDVLSNLPFVIAGILGLFFTLKPDPSFTPGQRWSYIALFAGLLLTGAVLSMINWRSRDFHLKSQRRNIRLVSVPSGTSAVASSKANATVNEA